MKTSWRRPIFPGRYQPSIVGTAQLNFRVRNGNGWTLCAKDTNCFLGTDHSIRPCQRRPIFPGRYQPSIVGTAQLNFCVRTGNRWTLRVNDTDYSFVCSYTVFRLVFDLSPTASLRVSGNLLNRFEAQLQIYLVHLQGLEPWTH